jgi:SAM-dependent methyltransferase
MQCSRCRREYPVCDGVPVLLHETSSVFTPEEIIDRRASYFPTASRAKQMLRHLVPRITANVKAEPNLRKLGDALLAQTARPVVLVVGGSVIGEGMRALLESTAIEFVETDIFFGPRTQLICDGHALPFEAGSFDGVIIQAVLEHVLEPTRCVGEIHRVLKERGLVYAEVPFMQQVHGRHLDFTRFTHLGLRRLFRNFEEIDSGATCGPGMALAWSYEYFLLSMARPRLARMLVVLFVRLTAFWLKYIDHLIITTPGTLDAASAYYLMGRKSDRPLPDQELLRSYQGAC